MINIKALAKLAKNYNNMTVAQAYKAYTKITGKHTVDVNFNGVNYGIAIDNVYNQAVFSPSKIIKQAKNQIAVAKEYRKSIAHNKSDELSRDALSDFCQKYYFWIKYSNDDSDSDKGPDEFRGMSEDEKVTEGYKLMVKDAKDIIARVKDDEKNGNGYYYCMDNMYLTTRYQDQLTLSDVDFTIENVLSKALYKQITESKPTMLTPREAKAIFDVRFQHKLVNLNWANNWAHFGSTDAYEDVNLTPQRANTICYARMIAYYALDNHVNVPAKDLLGKKVFKYNVKDAKKHSRNVVTE